MARFYGNENFPFPVVEELRRLGHDAWTIHEDGRAERRLPDDQVLAFDAAQNRCLLTLNRRHFIRLHSENSGHKGIVVCTYDPDFVVHAGRIHAAVAAAADMSGQLLRVNRPQA